MLIVAELLLFSLETVGCLVPVDGIGLLTAAGGATGVVLFHIF